METQASKSVFASKTQWANLILACASEWIPVIHDWVWFHPNTAILALAILNMLLRMTSWEALHLWRPKSG